MPERITKLVLAVLLIRPAPRELQSALVGRVTPGFRGIRVRTTA
jgi:hypothetical protein